MGPANSKQNENMDFSLSHPRFSNGKFVTQGANRLMQIRMGIDNKQYDKWKAQSEKQQLSQFLLLPLHHEFSSKGLCGSTGTLSINYDDYPYLLTQQIANRRGKKKIFEEQQIWYLLFGLLSAKRSINPSFSKIGDVRPHNIFLNDKGKLKISNIYSWPHQPTNFTKSFDNQITYLAPQQIKLLETGGVQSQKNGQSQLFSIGLTLLSAVTLQDFTNYYDLKKYFLNSSRINQRLAQFKINRAYSDILKGVICNLCQYDPNRRISSLQLWNWISPFQKSIRDSQNFFIPSAPEKIHQQVVNIRHFVQQQIAPSNLGPSLSSNLSGIRQSSFNYTINSNINQRLNFPPPIIKNNVLDTNVTQKPEGSSNLLPQSLSNNKNTSNNSTSGNNYIPVFSSIPTFNAESVYIPSTKMNQTNDSVNSGTFNFSSSYKQVTSNFKPSENSTPSQPQADPAKSQANNKNQ